jgi:hypothetical protein
MTRTEPDDVEAERARRWWLTRRRIGSVRRASEFISDVGFALLFPNRGVPLPSLWAAAGDRPLAEEGAEWGPDIQRVWEWKDELPRRGLAWYGRFLRGRPSFLSLELLENLYPRSGRPNDFEDAPLGSDAGRIASVLLRSGPLPAAVLRRAVNLEGKQGGVRFNAALTELGRALVLTHFGTEEEGSGWPSAVLELTVRAFGVKPPHDAAAARRAAADRFVRTMVYARPADLALAFGWGRTESRTALADLVSRGLAVRDGPGFRPVELSASPRRRGRK